MLCCYAPVSSGVMVETTGIEPVTPCMSSKYSNQLSYASKGVVCDVGMTGFEDLHDY